MKNIALIISLLLILTPALMAETSIDQLHLKRIHGETVLRIDASGPVQFNHQIKEAENGKPFRVIIDLFPAVHGLGQKSYTQLPQSAIEALRTSQFSVKPEKIVRVVLDLRKSAVYRIEKSGNYIFVYVPDAAAAEFPEWSSAANAAVKSTALASVTGAHSETNATRPASEGQSEKVPTPDPVVVAEEKTASESPSVAPIFAAESDNSVNAETNQANQVESPVTTSETGTLASDETPVVPSQPVATNKYARGFQSRFLDEEKSRIESKSESAPLAPNPVVAVTPDGTVEPASTQTAGDSVTVAASTPEKTNPPVIASTRTGQLVTRVEKKVAKTESAPEVSTAAPVEDKGKTDDIYFDSNIVAGSGSPDDLPAIDTPSDSAEGVKPTSRFRREPTFPNKLKGTIVAEFPQRMVIEYAPGQFRDPFETLIDDTKRTDGPRENRIPDVETSRLVGILESTNGDNRALLEDMDGFGYILKTGDKVKKGYVDRIDPDKAFFQLFEYGWSRTIALFLGHN
ncbi:conserved exported hypothetical protein [Candidatus Zixiibacteriota bacterium]|nr:conserved exported hypothetical protein [candidate division Zixibacteria bacterium]